MAISRSQNKIHISSTGTASEQQTKVVYILFTAGASGDTLVLRDTSSGPDILTIKAATANDTKIFRFAEAPILFNSGIYVQTITSGAKAVLITSQGNN